jgi:2-iminobutanoate/2-iminopropanoate deaminase
MAGLDPATGTIPEGIEAQTEQALVNLAAVPDPPPARSAPANVRLPRGLLVSIEAIAVLGRHKRA